MVDAIYFWFNEYAASFSLCTCGAEGKGNGNRTFSGLISKSAPPEAWLNSYNLTKHVTLVGCIYAPCPDKQWPPFFIINRVHFTRSVLVHGMHPTEYGVSNAPGYIPLLSDKSALKQDTNKS